CSQDKELPSTF
nr:immunoglobulin light chain junction region [Macaca mulatta]MOX25995.1 immunoglobulin light chain junction region [Macaca mulatta]MOX26887.1 immunoglobulin light chain junction region [Macaca mulatta]